MGVAKFKKLGEELYNKDDEWGIKDTFFNPQSLLCISTWSSVSPKGLSLRVYGVLRRSTKTATRNLHAWRERKSQLKIAY
jgi:hypothetical protein